MGLFAISVHPPKFVSPPGRQPAVTPLARLQAKENGGLVTSRQHHDVRLSEFQRYVVCRLDGQHDRPAIVEELSRDLRSGQMMLRREGQIIDYGDLATLGQLVDSAIEFLATAAMLVC